MHNFKCVIFVSVLVMAPHGSSMRPLPVSGQQQSLAELHEEDLFYEARASELAAAISHRVIRWVDLPPVMAPQPDRPPSGAAVKRVEDKVSPDKLIKKVFLLGGDEFSEGQLDSFSSEDGSLLSIAPHAVRRYVEEGPIDIEPFRPVLANLVMVKNCSQPGHTWYEVSIGDLENYVADCMYLMY